MVNQVFQVFQDAVQSSTRVLEAKHADVLLHTLTHTVLQLFVSDAPVPDLKTRFNDTCIQVFKMQ